MALPAYETFTGAFASPPNSNWSVAPGFGSGIYQNNGFCYGQSSWQMIYWNADSFNNNQYSKVKCVALINNGPAVRIGPSGSGNAYLLTTGDSIKDNLRIIKWVNGTPSQVGSTFSRTGADGDILELKAEGSTLKAYVNDIYQTEWTDTDLTSGYSGIGEYSSAGIMDDWEGGNVGAAGGLPIPVVMADYRQMRN